MASIQEDDLNSKMEEVEETLKELEQAFGPAVSVTSVVDVDDEGHELPPELHNLRISRIKAELNVVKNSPVTCITGGQEEQFEIFTAELEKDILELQETYSFVCGQHKDLDSTIKEEEEFLGQNTCVSEVLQKRLQSEKNRKEQDKAPDRHKEEIFQKIQKGENYLKEVVKKLVSFVEKHFPLPSQEVFSEQTKKLRSADYKTRLRDMISLKQILETLMNKCIEEPSDPYVVINHRYWPPYVELLLRCHIALRHPDDKDRIKLVPFFL